MAGRGSRPGWRTRGSERALWRGAGRPQGSPGCVNPRRCWAHACRHPRVLWGALVLFVVPASSEECPSSVCPVSMAVPNHCWRGLAWIWDGVHWDRGFVQVWRGPQAAYVSVVPVAVGASPLVDGPEEGQQLKVPAAVTVAAGDFVCRVAPNAGGRITSLLHIPSGECRILFYAALASLRGLHVPAHRARCLQPRARSLQPGAKTRCCMCWGGAEARTPHAHSCCSLPGLSARRGRARAPGRALRHGGLRGVLGLGVPVRRLQRALRGHRVSCACRPRLLANALPGPISSLYQVLQL